MTFLWIFLICMGLFLILLFLYALLKIARISDINAGYDEGMLQEEILPRE